MNDDDILSAAIYGELLGCIRQTHNDGRLIFEHRYMYYNSNVFELDIKDNQPTRYSCKLLEGDFPISYAMVSLRKCGAGLNHELINRITPKDAQKIVDDELIASRKAHLAQNSAI